MEAKLKALKVPELKEILTKSGTPIGSKSNKADLIAKILATPAALELAGGGGGEEAKAVGSADDDLLAPPDELDWDASADLGGAKAAPASAAEEPPAIETEAALPVTDTTTAESTEAPITDDNTATEAAPAEAPQATEDEDLARRQARATRFGIPLVEKPAAGAAKGPRAPRAKGKAAQPVVDGGKKATETGKKADAGSGNKKTEGKKTDEAKPPKISAKESAPNDDDAKLAARAARFGISTPATTSKAAEGGSTDPAEEERKKKREARFGAPTAKKAKTDT